MSKRLVVRRLKRWRNHWRAPLGDGKEGLGLKSSAAPATEKDGGA